MRVQINDRDYEQLSAYLDEQLSSGEMRKLEDRLRARPDLQALLDDLRRTKALLRAAPRRRAPRNFTLTPAMIGDSGPRKRKSGFLGLFPALSFTSALAAFALVASLVFELLPGMNASLANVREEKATALMGAAATQPAQENQRAMQEQPSAAADSAAVEPAPAAAPEMQALEAAPAENSMPPGEPPVILWNPGVNMGSGGGGGPESSKFPGAYAPMPGGLGGGAADSLWLGPSGGAIVVPLEGVNSLGPEAEAAPPVMKEESAPGSGGPILGIPPADQGGEITASSGWGQPPATAPAAEVGLTAPEGALRPPPALLSPVRLVQLLLGLLALGTGAAAFLLRKR